MKEKLLVLFFINVIWQFIKWKYRKIRTVYYLDIVMSAIIILFLLYVIYVWIIFYDIISRGVDKNDLQMLLSLSGLVLFYITKIISYFGKKKFLVLKKICLIVSIIIELLFNLYPILY
ncbi:hypothetical protein [Pseudoleptotrichia goodfellowii]|uniref:Uncharacterized protein n=1 Tax=Pseudoleptotrichia goodfellowii TaxID=157692 RepID=A0A510JCE6_9FUSO|nr:hypothetical protein [Pseudoleptotrichia goodfellowii]BBM36766.1 hypothetical protein JCM16774_1711 [Pseudoleptotrichia goodfellowii]